MWQGNERKELHCIKTMHIIHRLHKMQCEQKEGEPGQALRIKKLLETEERTTAGKSAHIQRTSQE